MKFVIKQLAGLLATPLAIALFIAVVAAAFRLFGRRRLWTWLSVVAAAVAYLGALPPVSNALLAPLEQRYPPLREDQPLPQLSAIVVLGSGYDPRDNIPVTAALEEDGLARVVEGVRLAQRFHITPLVVSGGAPAGVTPSAHGYARLARELGMPASALIVLDTPLDTAQEARAVARVLGNAQFLLVTSAAHMPRAMRLMRRAGTRPIAAPTAQHAGGSVRSVWHNFIPSGSSVRGTERALHEYLGLAALSLGTN